LPLSVVFGALVGGLGSFPFERGDSPPRSDSRGPSGGIRSWVPVGTRGGPQPDSVALPPPDSSRGWPSSHFGENELSPGLMTLSVLPTGRPPVFQHWWVRSSTPCYGRFNLPMGRSPGFASIAPDMRPVQTRFPWGSPPEAVNHGRNFWFFKLKSSSILSC